MIDVKGAAQNGYLNEQLNDEYNGKDYENQLASIFTTVTLSADEWVEEVRQGYHGDLYFDDVLIALSDEQKADNGLVVVEPIARSGWVGAISHLRSKKAYKQHYTLTLDHLITHKKSGSLCIPINGGLWQRVMAEVPDTPLGGHFGIKRTASALVHCFFWPRMYQDIKQYVRGCAICHPSKSFN